MKRNTVAINARSSVKKKNLKPEIIFTEPEQELYRRRRRR